MLELSRLVASCVVSHSRKQRNASIRQLAIRAGFGSQASHTVGQMPGTSDLDQGAPSLSMLIRPVVAVIGKKKLARNHFQASSVNFSFYVNLVPIVVMVTMVAVVAMPAVPVV